MFIYNIKNIHLNVKLNNKSNVELTILSSLSFKKYAILITPDWPIKFLFSFNTDKFFKVFIVSHIIFLLFDVNIFNNIDIPPFSPIFFLYSSKKNN